VSAFSTQSSPLSINIHLHVAVALDLTLKTLPSTPQQHSQVHGKKLTQEKMLSFNRENKTSFTTSAEHI
jgi:hypothetical protein